MSRRGVALITVVVIMLTVALIGMSLVELLSSVSDSAHTVLDETKARYLAEAGIAAAIHKLRGQASSEEKQGEKMGPILLGDGSYTVFFNSRESLITSLGTVNGITKKLQLQYDVF